MARKILKVIYQKEKKNEKESFT